MIANFSVENFFSIKSAQKISFEPLNLRQILLCLMNIRMRLKKVSDC